VTAGPEVPYTLVVFDAVMSSGIGAVTVVVVVLVWQIGATEAPATVGAGGRHPLPLQIAVFETDGAALEFGVTANDAVTVVPPGTPVKAHDRLPLVFVKLHTIGRATVGHPGGGLVTKVVLAGAESEIETLPDWAPVSLVAEML